MNLAGGLATLLFAITIITVLGGLLAYGTYKARERGRSRAQKSSKPGRAMEFFVEYTLDEGLATAPSSLRGYQPPQSGGGALKAIIAVTLVVAVGAGSFFAWRAISTAPMTTTVSSTSHDAAPSSSIAQPVARTGAPDLSSVPARKPSLFVSDASDLNVNGKVDPDERALIHSEVPQFIIVGCDDNGSVEGLAWMRRVFEEHKLWGKPTFFMTGNYLKGRPNYLGGPIDDWWQVQVFENYVGLHGLTHAPGADAWNVDRWLEENRTVHDEIERRFATPKGWSWKSYPWGTRAPFLLMTDAYFQSLDKLDRKIFYDASLVARPAGTPPTELNAPRDLPWPFTLDNALPPEIEQPFLPNTESRAQIGKHALWEVPVYAWLMKIKGKSEWQPSLDFNLWKFYGCEGGKVNEEAVAVLIDNLKGHYRGNRAPFHIGLHAQNYTADKACERATVARAFEQIDRLIDEGYNLRYAAMPELLVWLGRPKK